MDNCITLTDSKSGCWIENCDEQMGPFRVVKQTLRGGAREGVDVIEVQCGKMRTRIIPTRGMGIQDVEISDVPEPSISDVAKFGWDSPIQGPIHPTLVPISEPSGLGWLSGFDELFVRCGLGSNGAPEFDDAGRLVYPLHGRIANLPSDQVEIVYDASEDSLVVKGTIFESRFHFAKWKLEVEYRFDANKTSIHVHDRVTNFGGTENAFQMLYHFNLGNELLEPGGLIAVPTDQVVPRNEHSAGRISQWKDIEEPQAGYTESVYFMSPNADGSGNALAMIANADRTCAAGIRFQPETLPCFSLWKNFAAREDGYVVGLEPATNYPNTRGFEEGHGRTVSLAPGQTSSLELELIFAESHEKVTDLLDECNSMQATEPPELVLSPDPDCCE